MGCSSSKAPIESTNDAIHANSAPSDAPPMSQPQSTQPPSAWRDGAGGMAAPAISAAVAPSNAEKHHTDLIAGMGAVARRGQAIEFVLSGAQDGLTWRASLKATTGNSRPDTYKAPAAAPVAVSPDGATSEWAVVVTGSALLLCTPPDAAIGRYEVTIKAKTASGTTVRAPPVKLLLLFNPWAAADVVHMPKPEERDEWVLNEEGTLYQGSAWYVSSKPWVFDQFHPEVLAVVVDKLCGRLSRGELADPTLLSRRMSSLCNGNDNGGVLIGNWSGDYPPPATAPVKWTGSLAILQQWAKSGPVRYGQCFNFAAVLCTVMRALGVPCRPVSNYWSAHDGGYDRGIDKYFESDGSKSGLTEDSIWTFHVWCDAWFARPDLGGRPSPYDGWQAIDATPQEVSDGLWQMGPAPVRAVFQGRGGVPYDTEFVIGEVNADERHWHRRVDGKGWDLLKINATKMGPFLLTRWDTGGAPLKLPENMSKVKDTLDVMQLYKPAEGSAAERATLHNAFEVGGDVSFAATVTTGASVGDALELRVTADGGGASFVLEAYAASYSGRAGRKLKGTTAEGAVVTLTLSADEYKGALTDTSCAFEFRAFGSTAAGQHWAQVLQTVLAPPELVVTPPAGGAAEGEYTVSFTNPCSYALGAASLSFSATRGLQVEVLLGSGGQQVAAGATAQWRLAVRRDAAVAGGGGGATARPLRRGVVSLEADTEVLTDINGAIEVKF